MENTEIVDDFSAFFEDGNQAAQESAEEVETSETGSEETGRTEADSEETPEEEGEASSESDGDGNSENAEKPNGDTNADQTFTIKVNKEEHTVGIDEMKALAQKGADYDRIKEQNAQKQQTIDTLQAKLDGISSQQGALDILGIVAEKSGSTLEQLAESLYVNFRRTAGASEETAREELKSAKLEKELNAFKAQKTKQQEQESGGEARAKQDLADFQREYPDVPITEELVDKLISDIQSGMSLSAAYRKYEKAQDAERIADLERKLAAEKKNAENKKKSPGSQVDSGSRQKADIFDEFMAAFK